MITGTDRPTEQERRGAPDCLVELALAWLQRPLGGLTELERGQAIDDVCLLIAQMRHRNPVPMDLERRRWAERVAVRLCVQCAGMRGYEGAVQVELERRITIAMLQFSDWRDRVAPKFGQRSATGPGDGNGVTA